MLLSSDLERLLGLEGCLAGKVPRAGLPREGGYDGPCGQLDRLGTVKVVIGPGTFVNEAVEADRRRCSPRRAAEPRRRPRQNEQTIRRLALAQGRGAAEAHRLGEEAGKVDARTLRPAARAAGGRVRPQRAAQRSTTRASCTRSCSTTPRSSPGTPKQRFAYLFPGREAALDLGAPEGGLERSAAHAHDRAGPPRARDAPVAAAARRALPAHGRARDRLRTRPSSITHSIELLLVAVLLAMAARAQPRLPRAPAAAAAGVAALAAALTFGALAAVGASLTVAQVAVLPVLVGLAVDYAIQFHVARAGGRAQERRRRRSRAAVRARRRGRGTPRSLAAAAAGAGALLGA